MKSKKSSTSKVITLNSSISDLYAKASKTAENLEKANIKTIEDLFWTLPRKIVKLPDVSKFAHANIGDYFRGRGKVLSIQARPNFKARGKGRAMLYNIAVIVQDSLSDDLLTLRWFNCYGSVQNKLKKLDDIEFLGVVSEFNEQLQITNPDYDDPIKFETTSGLKIQYPTIEGVSTVHIKKVVDKIPMSIWDNLKEVLPEQIIEENNFLTRSEAFKYLHGKVDPKVWEQSEFERAKERLIYEEFFLDQIKLDIRKKHRRTLVGKTIDVCPTVVQSAYQFFPYQLTKDQESCLQDVIADFKSGSPMMRLVQGDVGCGKTTIALMACYFAIKSGHQAAFMCPTESLATQQFHEALKYFGHDVKISVLLGSQSAKEKSKILDDIASGETQLVVGTHALFQDSVIFKDLGVSIIDEQHKFGVNQRVKLVSKGEGSHCLIMSATPIPRSLSLTQYGDLDISVVSTMPSGRKGSKTRIVEPHNFENFLSFIKTRVEMGEQAYILVPAINESPDQNIKDVTMTLEKFKHFFPNLKISPLHGQMKAEEKAQAFKDFKDKKIDILVATSVIEVGINVINATIMAILNPERFGLSSLHQMRGRVGRGEKPGFCFLIVDRELAPESMQRLKVIESSSDGFKIAEEDLKMRGQGDLFGSDQSGVVTQKRIANIIMDQSILYKVIQDFKRVKNSSTDLSYFYDKVESDQRILSTI